MTWPGLPDTGDTATSGAGDGDLDFSSFFFFFLLFFKITFLLFSSFSLSLLLLGFSPMSPEQLAAPHMQAILLSPTVSNW